MAVVERKQFNWPAIALMHRSDPKDVLQTYRVELPQ
jgi:hypothetical protein